MDKRGPVSPARPLSAALCSQSSPPPPSEIFDIVSALETAEGKGTTFCMAHVVTLRSVARLTTARSQTRSSTSPREQQKRTSQSRTASAPSSSSASLPLRIFSFSRLPLTSTLPQPRQEPRRQGHCGPLCPPWHNRRNPEGRGEEGEVRRFGLSGYPGGDRMRPLTVRTVAFRYDHFHDNGVPRWRGKLSWAFRTEERH